jgi:putative inorganic carbon (HCO3(-)) transporter
VDELPANSAGRLAEIQRWTLRAGLFLLPLAYSWNSYDHWVLPKLLAARLLVIVLLVLLIARVVAERRLVIKRTPLDLPVAAFMASAALSTAFATNLNVAIFGVYSRYDGLLTLLTYATLFWLTVQTLEGPDDVAALLKTMLASAYLVAAIAIVQTVVASFPEPSVWLRFTDVVKGDVVRAYGTLGQWNVLGGFLAMTWPLALREVGAARTAAGRILAANVVLVVGIALLLTFSRSSWAGALIGTAAILAGDRSWRDRRVVASGLVTAAGVGVLALALAAAGGSQFEHALIGRAGTVFQPSAWEDRPLYWSDTLKLIASRPIVGYGPDSFGLVFPRFTTVYFQQPVDKAHAETLQIAATQGMIGLAAYAWLLVAFVLAFWRGRRKTAAYAMFGGWLAYELSLQINFTALGSAFPFWIFAAAAMHSWGGVSTSSPIAIRSWGRVSLRLGIAGLAMLAVVGVLFPYLADVSLLEAVEADAIGRAGAGRSLASQALFLSPRESVYAVEVANIAFEHDDWSTARAYYLRAAELGTYNPLVYRNLAFVDRNLGLIVEARAAALAAYELNRFDPVNQAVLAQFDGKGA